MRTIYRSVSRYCAALVLGLSVASCGGGGGSSLLEEGASAVLDFLSDGAFSDLDSLVTALEGDQLVIEDFGTSELGTNPGILPRGSALVDDISCGADSCTGQVLVPKITNGVLVSFTRETGTITREGEESFVISSPSIETMTFTKHDPTEAPPPAPEPGGGTPTLDKTASCERWWEAVANRTWSFVSVRDFSRSVEEPDVSGATLKFTGKYSDLVTQRTWSVQGTDYMSVTSGTQVNLDDGWGDQELCRFYLIFPNSGGGGEVIWAHSLSGGQLRFVLNPDLADTTEEWILRAN